MAETEILDKLFLELSQITKAKTGDQVELESLLSRAVITQRAGQVLLVFGEETHARKMYQWLERHENHDD